MFLSRRSFLKTSAATAVVSTGFPHLLQSSYASKTADNISPNKWRGRVAINFNKNAVSDYTTKKVNKEVIFQMVDETIMLLTGKKEVGEAWKEIFPATLTENSKIAIKTNFYAPNLMPPPEALLAIVSGLRKMVINGKEFTGAITIYEGNTSNTFAGVGYNEADFTKLNVKLEKVSSFPAKTDLPQGESGYAKVVEDADFLFNVFSARGHDSFAEGLSLGFKSHYGTYSTSGPNIHGSNGGFSKRACNLHCTGVISKKQVLSISCAFFCNDEGTSMGTGNPARSSFTTYVKTIDSTANCESPSTLIMSTDPISCEMQVIKLLRLNKNKPYSVSSMPKYLQAAGGISGALQGVEYNIGEIDESKMEIRKIINGNNTDIIHPIKGNFDNRDNLLLTSTSFQNHVLFIFRAPGRYIGQKALLSIYNLSGQEIYSKELYIGGIVNHFSWDFGTNIGTKIRRGRYIANLKTLHFTLSREFIAGL